MQVTVFDINLKWIAIEKAVVTNSTETFIDKENGIKITSNVHGKLAQAVASGLLANTVTGVNFTSEPSQTATIDTESDGIMTVERTK